MDSYYVERGYFEFLRHLEFHIEFPLEILPITLDGGLPFVTRYKINRFSFTRVHATHNIFITARTENFAVHSQYGDCVCSRVRS